MPSYGYVPATLYSFLAIVLGTLQMEAHPTPRVFLIHVLRRGQLIPWNPPVPALLVRAAYAGARVPPTLYLGDQRIPWRDLETVLRNELARRPPSWPVYFEGDPEMEWGSAVTIMDRIRRAGADVVMLPKR